MRAVFILVILGLSLKLVGYCQEKCIVNIPQNTLILNGYYNGKNIFVQNPWIENSKRFCVQRYPCVNGNVTTRMVESSAFEIDLKCHLFKIGDKIEIKIEHGVSCRPKILNPEVLRKNYTVFVDSVRRISFSDSLKRVIKKR